MTLTLQLEQEADGGWIAGSPISRARSCMGASPEEATAKAKAFALRVLAARLEHGEAEAGIGDIAFVAA